MNLLKPIGTLYKIEKDSLRYFQIRLVNTSRVEHKSILIVSLDLIYVALGGKAAMMAIAESILNIGMNSTSVNTKCVLSVLIRDENSRVYAPYFAHYSG